MQQRYQLRIIFQVILYPNYHLKIYLSPSQDEKQHFQEHVITLRVIPELHASPLIFLPFFTSRRIVTAIDMLSDNIKFLQELSSTAELPSFLLLLRREYHERQEACSFRLLWDLYRCLRLIYLTYGSHCNLYTKNSMCFSGANILSSHSESKILSL